MGKELPNNWCWSDLDSVLVRMTNGSSLKQSDVEEPNLLPISRIETIANEEVNFERVKYVNASDQDIEKYVLRKGDILFSHINSDKHLGKTAIYDDPRTLIHGINLLLLRSSSKYDSFLLNYLLRHYRYSGKFIEVAQRSVNQSSINQKKLNAFQVPIIPLPEQKRIVAKLDNLFAHLEEVKGRLANVPELLKQFRQSVLTRAVTGKLTEEWRVGKGLSEWKTVAIGDVCESIVPGRDKPKSFTGTIPWVTTPGITGNTITSQNAEYFLSDEEIDQVRAKRIPVDSVVLSIVGRFGIASVVKEECVINQQLHAFLPSAEVAPDYLMFTIRTLENHMNSVSSATTVKYINKTKANNLPINLPGIAEQTEIVRRVEGLFVKADIIQEQYESLVQKIDDLTPTILAKAFRGELVEQLDSDGDARELLEEIKKLKAEVKPKRRKN